ncbi:hypothetical protein ACFXKG_28460 [Streptomyces sp. NPDC059255]|uniref:hypothetical protein n=1 Tax=Streptomyces sp. NPDC059255 TaxID=3346793 RepID=UPI0036B06B34
MGNRADDQGTDVEIYRKPLSDTIIADTATGSPAELLDMLDLLGLERKEVRTSGPVYIWHEVPAHLDPEEQKRLASRAIPWLLIAGCKANCTPEVFDEAAYQQAVRAVRGHQTHHIGQHPAPAAPDRATPPRRVP